jgi:hypothetical protein
LNGPRRQSVRDRDVVALMALVAIAVIVANVVAAFVPGLDELLAGLPLVVVLLIVVTALVLVRALRGRRPA